MNGVEDGLEAGVTVRLLEEGGFVETELKEPDY